MCNSTKTINYYNAQDITGWQGIRSLDKHNYMITGTRIRDGILNIGPITYNPLNNYIIKYPGASSSSIYGPDAKKGTTKSILQNKSSFKLVGSYTNENDSNTYGMIYQGKLSDINNPLFYKTIVTGGKYTYVHSVMKKLAVLNYDSPAQYNTYNLPLGPGNAAIYNIKKNTLENIKYPGSITTTAYGIWHNGDNSYTICGGYSTKAVEITSIYVNGKPKPIGSSYLVDYDLCTGKFTNWTSFSSINTEAHFQGISKYDNKYQVSLDVVNGNALNGFWLEVKRSKNNFIIKKTVAITYPNSTSCTNDSVANNTVVGIAIVNDKLVSYQAKLS